MKKTTWFSVFSVIALCMSTLGSAYAADRRVSVINNTSYTLERLYGSNVDTGSWEDDIFRSGVLLPGYRVNVNFDDGTGHCRFDLKAVFSNGAVVVRRNVNVCAIEHWTISDGD